MCVFLDADFSSTVNGTIPGAPPGDGENAAFSNAVSGGLLGAVVAAGLVLVRTLKSIFLVIERETYISTRRSCKSTFFDDLLVPWIGLRHRVDIGEGGMMACL